MTKRPTTTIKIYSDDGVDELINDLNSDACAISPKQFVLQLIKTYGRAQYNAIVSPIESPTAAPIPSSGESVETPIEQAPKPAKTAPKVNPDKRLFK